MSPLALSALALLLVNDHDLKQRWPSALTGKLSDLAGLVLLPIVLQALLELLRGRVSAAPWQTRACCLVAAFGFVLLELWPPASWLFRASLGVLQWPLRALLAGSWVELSWVRHVADREDLLALPALLLPWWYGTRRARRALAQAREQSAIGLSMSVDAAAAECHAGRRQRVLGHEKVGQ